MKTKSKIMDKHFLILLDPSTMVPTYGAPHGGIFDRQDLLDFQDLGIIHRRAAKCAEGYFSSH